MRSPVRPTATLLAPALLALPGALRAQLTPTAPAGPRVGILAGLSSATIGGSDAALDPSEGLKKKRRNALVAGAYLVFPVAGLPLSFRPELLYAQKGVRAQGPSYPPTVQILPGQSSSDGTLTVTTRLDYLELPVLLQLDIPNTAGLRPSLYAGPSVAYRVRCRIDENFSGSTVSTGCGDNGDDSGLRKFDLSGVVGGQLGFVLGGQSLGVGARYTHGFTKLGKDVDVKNRAFAVYGSIEFGR